jgi:nicotinamidase-related amidase
LEAELRERQIQTLVLTGYSTEFCVDATLRNACSRSYKVVVAADAHTTHDNPVLPARKVIELHNWAWANCAATPRVSVLESSQIAFPSGVIA